MATAGDGDDPSGGEPGCLAVAYATAAALLALAALVYVWVEYVRWGNLWKVFAGAAATVAILTARDAVQRWLGLPGGRDDD